MALMRVSRVFVSARNHYPYWCVCECASNCIHFAQMDITGPGKQDEDCIVSFPCLASVSHSTYTCYVYLFVPFSLEIRLSHAGPIFPSHSFSFSVFLPMMTISMTGSQYWNVEMYSCKYLHLYYIGLYLSFFSREEVEKERGKEKIKPKDWRN